MTRSRRARAYRARLLGRQAVIGARCAADLRAFFRRQARRVVARYLGYVVGVVKVALPGDLLPPEEQAALRAVIEPYLRAMIVAASEQAAAAVGVAPFVDTSPEIQALIERATYYLDGITTTTARQIARVIEAGSARHYSAWQIANGVSREGFAGLRQVIEGMGGARAETIARTVMAVATQAAAHDRYAARGVREVDILDGPGCGWVSHKDADKANGTRRSLAAAQMHPIAHPRCRRVSLPVLDDTLTPRLRPGGYVQPPALLRRR